MRRFAFLILGLLVMSGCNEPSKPELHDRERVLAALQGASVTDSRRWPLHLSHTCDLKIDDDIYPVLDVREIIPFMAAPRGINHIVVMDSSLAVMQAFRYIDQRPLSCYGDRLLLFAEMQVETRMGHRAVIY